MIQGPQLTYKKNHLILLLCSFLLLLHTNCKGEFFVSNLDGEENNNNHEFDNDLEEAQGEFPPETIETESAEDPVTEIQEIIQEQPAEPVEEINPGPCSGHGTPYTWSDGTYCACDRGYTPSSPAGSDCVPTGTVCTGGPIPSPIDIDGNGTQETEFQPSSLECLMYELVNRTRATHDNEGTPECHSPLMYNREWSAHGRHHSRLMYERGGLFHDDFPWGQNCAYGCDPECEMNMYMSYPGEDHCPPLSHHCNIMSCDYSQIGIGYWTPEEGTWNTQNFL